MGKALGKVQERTMQISRTHKTRQSSECKASRQGAPHKFKGRLVCLMQNELNKYKAQKRVSRLTGSCSMQESMGF